LTQRRLAVGAWGEEEAAHFITQRGWVVLGRNVRTPYGEIDLVARQGDEIVFIEVKTRTTSSLGPPEIAVTVRKRRHMLDSASYFMQEHPEYDGHWRVDVAAVTRSQAGEIEVVYFENAVNEDAS